MTKPEDLDLEGEVEIFHRPRTALIPIFSGTISAFGSYLVIRELWIDFWPSSFGRRSTAAAAGNRRPGQSNMRSCLVRCLIAMSFMDFISSIAFAFTTVPSPAWLTYVPYTQGNTTTCELQGFFMQLWNMATPLFATLLTFFYTVILNFEWNDSRIFKVEIWMHCLIWTVSLACAIFPIPLGLYNNAYHVCWINGYPEGCEYVKEDVPCERGGDYIFWSTIFTVFPLWPCLLAIAVMMCLLYSKVRRVEVVSAARDWGVNKSSAELQVDGLSDGVPDDETSSNNQETQEQESSSTQPPDNSATPDERPSVTTEMEVNRRRSRAVAIQAFLFVTAFILTQFLRLSTTLWWAIAEGVNRTLYVWAYDVMLPLQGWLNALVLLRTRSLHTPEGKFLQRAMKFPSNFEIGALWPNNSPPPEVEEERSPQPASNELAVTTPVEANGSFINIVRDSLDLYGSRVKSNAPREINSRQSVSSHGRSSASSWVRKVIENYGLMSSKISSHESDINDSKT